MRVSKRESALPGSIGEPLIAESVDLRNYCWMKLDVCRLAGSDFFHLADNEEFGAGVKLWTAAMRQVPAGSLPNNNRIIASLAGYANAPRRWSRVREMALYGWVPCSDGRLYHPVLAELVMDIQESITAKKNRVDVLSPQEERKRKTRERVRKWRMAQKETMDTASLGSSGPVTSSGVPQPSVTGSGTVTQKSVTGCVTDSVTVTHVIEEEEKKNREREESNTHRNAESVTDGVTQSVTKPVTNSVTKSVTKSDVHDFFQQNKPVAASVLFPDQDGDVSERCTSSEEVGWECTSLVEPDDAETIEDEFFHENIFLNSDAPYGGAERLVETGCSMTPKAMAESESPLEADAKEKQFSRTMAILFSDTVEEAQVSTSMTTQEAEPVTTREVGCQPEPDPVQDAEVEVVQEVHAEREPEYRQMESGSADGEHTPPPLAEEGGQNRSNASPRFEEFWSVYPNKVGKKPCMKKWKVRKLDRKADQIIADIQKRLVMDARWLNGYIPNPLTYLNQDRWEDEIKTPETRGRAWSLEPDTSAGSPEMDVQPKRPGELVLNTAESCTPVLQVFSRWCQVMQQDGAVLDERRRQIIVRTLETHGLRQCMEAIDGCAASPFHMGDNDKSTPFNDISLIFRDADHVEKFIGIHRRTQKSHAGVAGIMGEEAAQWCRTNLSKPGQKTADNLANWMAMSSGQERK